MPVDKKKLIVLAALGVVILGIGAFQFMPSSSPAHPAEPKKRATTDATETAAKDTAKIQLVPTELQPRDPFEVPDLQDDQKMQPPTQPTPPQQPVGSFAGHLPGGRPAPLQGNLAPLPVATPDPAPVAGRDKEGGKPLAEPAFGYRLAGVMMGARPLAVFADSTGSQRLVSVGSSIDGDSKLLSVDKGQAIVMFRGKQLRLVLGGEAGAK